MKVIFPNSAFVPAPERVILRGGRWRQVQVPVRYGLVIHPQHGPVLIDTGYTGHAVSAKGRSPALRAYSRALRPRLVAGQDPVSALHRYGFMPEDVKTVIVTHFHADHVSGLALFPDATFIADAVAFENIRSASRWQNTRHGIFTELLPHDFAHRLTDIRAGRFDPVFDAYDILGDGLLFAKPLAGHAAGHFGVLFPALEPQLCYAVDTQWLLPAVTDDRAPGYPARMICDNVPDWLSSTKVIADMHRNGWDVVLCHDPQPSAYDPETP